MTWKGWTRTLKWKESFPLVLVTYLFAQILAASKASLDNCSYSSDTRWQQKGNSSTLARLRPKSNILIYETADKSATIESKGRPTNFGVRYTSVKTRFGKWLVFAITVTTCRSTTHLIYKTKVSLYPIIKSCGRHPSPPQPNPPIQLLFLPCYNFLQISNAEYNKYVLTLDFIVLWRGKGEEKLLSEGAKAVFIWSRLVIMWMSKKGE